MMSNNNSLVTNVFCKHMPNKIKFCRRLGNVKVVALYIIRHLNNGSQHTWLYSNKGLNDIDIYT